MLADFLGNGEWKREHVVASWPFEFMWSVPLTDAQIESAIWHYRLWQKNGKKPDIHHKSGWHRLKPRKRVENRKPNRWCDREQAAKDIARRHEYARAKKLAKGAG